MNDKQLKNPEIANKEIDRLARIINDFLEISRIEAGKIKIQHVAIQSLVNDVVELLKPIGRCQKYRIEDLNVRYRPVH